MRTGEHGPRPAAASVRGRLPRRVAPVTVGACLVALVAAAGVGSGGVASGATTTTKKSTAKSTVKTTTKSATKTTVKAATKTTAKASTEVTLTTKKGDAATTTVDVRPVTESTTTVAKSSSTASTTTVAVKSVKGTVFIPGAGRVLDLGANEVAKLAAGGRVETDVRGASGLAASGTGTVILDVTVSNPATPGRVTLLPVAPDFARSVVQSSVAFQAGATTVSRVAVPVGSGGLVRVTTSPGPSGLAITVVGWVVSAPAGSTEPSAIALDTCRVLDTTTGAGGLQGEITPARPFDLPAVGIAKIPGALTTSGPAPSTVIMSVTASQATGPLELRVVPTGSESPEVKLFMNTSQTTAATFAVPVGNDARAAFYVSAAGTQVAVDVVGWLDRDNTARSAGPC